MRESRARGALLRAHALATMGDRLWDFAVAVYAAGDDLPLVVGVAGQLAAACASPWVGRFADRMVLGPTPCLVAVALQNVALTCLVLLVSFMEASWERTAACAVLAMTCGVASSLEDAVVAHKWTSVMLVKASPTERQRHNSALRECYLVSKLVAPFIISLLFELAASSAVPLVAVCLYNLLSGAAEMWLLRRAWTESAALQNYGRQPEPAEQQEGLWSSLESVQVYWAQPAVGWSLAYVLLYASILCPGAFLYAHMSHAAVPPWHLAFFQAAASLVSLGGSRLAKAAPSSTRLTLRQTALLMLLFQTAAVLAAAVVWFFFFSPLPFLGLIVLSRVGLWGFDVAHLGVMQKHVSLDVIGRVSTIQNGLCQAVSVASILACLIWSAPAHFGSFVVMSVVVLLLACVLFAAPKRVKSKRA